MPNPTDPDIISIETETLPVKLGPDAYAAVSRDLGKTVRERLREEVSQKDRKDAMKARLSELDAKIARLSVITDTGEDYQEVEVETRWADDGRMVERVRVDTGEVISSRPPSNTERQAKLALEV